MIHRNPWKESKSHLNMLIYFSVHSKIVGASIYPQLLWSSLCFKLLSRTLEMHIYQNPSDRTAFYFIIHWKAPLSPGAFLHRSFLLKQTLSISYKARKLETVASVPEGGFCSQWCINHSSARNSTTKTWQWFFPSPFPNAHGSVHSVTSSWGQLLSSRWWLVSSSWLHSPPSTPPP